MNRLVLLTGLFLGPALMSGLFSCGNSCGGPYKYQIQDYRVLLSKVKPQNASWYPLDSLTTGQTITYREVELHLVAEEQQVAAHRVIIGSDVWACDPAIIPLDRIKNKTVRRPQSYRAALPAGSDLKPILSAGLGGGSQQPLAEVLASSSQRAESIVSLRFAQAPDQSAQHEFTIEIELIRGPIFVRKTKPVTITP